MTRRLLAIAILIAVIAFLCNPAAAFQKKGLLNIGDQFNLSEPEVEDLAEETSD